MNIPESKRTKVFISYSHRDADWLARLRVHLKPLERDYGAIEFWDDTKIRAGSLWKDEISNALASTGVVVLLISADFFASDFITSNELPLLLSTAATEGIIIIPLIISSSLFSETPELYKFQAVNDLSRPLIDMSKGEQEAVLVKLTKQIKAALNSHVVAPANNDDGHKEIHEAGKIPRAHFNNKRGVALVLIAALVILTAGGYWLLTSKSTRIVEVQHFGKVIDKATLKAISNAKVTVESQGSPQIYYSDSEGAFSMMLPKAVEDVHVKVEAEGYQAFDKPISFSGNRDDFKLSLAKIETPIQPETPKQNSPNQNRPKKVKQPQVIKTETQKVEDRLRGRNAPEN